MTSDNLTNELKSIIKHIKENVVDLYPTTSIDANCMLLGILEKKDSVAYRSLAKSMLDRDIDTLTGIVVDKLASQASLCIMPPKKDFPLDNRLTDMMDEIIEAIGYVNSGDLLVKMIQNDEFISKQFKALRLSAQRLSVCVAREMKDMFSDEIPESVAKSKKQKETKEPVATKNPKPANTTRPTVIDVRNLSGIIQNIMPEYGSGVLKSLHSYNAEAAAGRLTKAIGCENIYRDIFQTLSRKTRNNVVLTGTRGCGKTTIAKGLANILVSDSVPKPFKGKMLLELNMPTMMSFAAYRGALESRFREIADDASKGHVIIFIDNIDEILESRISDSEAEDLIDILTSNDNVMVIATCGDKGYSTHIEGSARFSNTFHRIKVKEPDDDVIFQVTCMGAEKLEAYHSVKFSEDTIGYAITMAKRWNPTANTVDAALDILDEAGARAVLTETEDPRLKELNDDLAYLRSYKKRLLASTAENELSQLPSVEQEESELIKKIADIEKENAIKKENQPVTDEDIAATVSAYFGIEIEKATLDEKRRLRSLNAKIAEEVIGQDKAVEEVCRVVRRQRVGLGREGKPSVLFFGGSTGTGKTYLAKKIAEHVFGSEKNMVRLDMSEYADKMSVNKLYGSAHGYVGFDNGGLLTNAIREKQRCVLLLDEIEKANTEVFNVFLQVFDDGRLTDNKGNVVSFKDVIIIMTSNIGASEVAERGKGIGFVTDAKSNAESIVRKALKRTFKPEFLNRIDSIVYFNDLGDDELKAIIGLEIAKIGRRLESNGYTLDESLTGEKTIGYIDGVLKSENEKYNARSIARAVQKHVEDAIADYIIDNDIKDGHSFTYEEIIGAKAI